MGKLLAVTPPLTVLSHVLGKGTCLTELQDGTYQMAHGKRRFISGGLIRTSGSFCSEAIDALSSGVR